MCAKNIDRIFLLDELGSFLFLTKEANVSFLAVANEDMMQTYVIVIKDFKLPPDIVKGINNKTLMPFFLNNDDFNLAPSEWPPYMHSVTILQGLEKYYYSYIAKLNQNIYKLKNKIVSYNEFLASQEIGPSAMIRGLILIRHMQNGHLSVLKDGPIKLDLQQHNTLNT